MTLLAEDLLLLLLDDETGKMDGWVSYVDTALGGALLIELASTGALEVRKGERLLAGDRVVATGTHSPEDPVLARALSTVEEKERSPTDLVNRLGKGVKDELLERLAARGILQRQQGRVLGLFPRTTWPAADSRHEDTVRERLHNILARNMEPDDRSAALIALLHALGIAHRTIRDDVVPARVIRKRAKEVAEGNWGAKAVRDAIASAMAAVTAATAAGGGSAAAASS